MPSNRKGRCASQGVEVGGEQTGRREGESDCELTCVQVRESGLFITEHSHDIPPKTDAGRLPPNQVGASVKRQIRKPHSRGSDSERMALLQGFLRHPCILIIKSHSPPLQLPLPLCLSVSLSYFKFISISGSPEPVPTHQSFLFSFSSLAAVGSCATRTSCRAQQPHQFWKVFGLPTADLESVIRNTGRAFVFLSQPRHLGCTFPE